MFEDFTKAEQKLLLLIRDNPGLTAPQLKEHGRFAARLLRKLDKEHEAIVFNNGWFIREMVPEPPPDRPRPVEKVEYLTESEANERDLEELEVTFQAEQENWRYAEVFKRKLRDAILKAFDEYCDEAEHQDGFGYWQNFNENKMEEAVADFAGVAYADATNGDVLGVDVMLRNVSKGEYFVKLAIKAQMEDDKRTGAVGLEEACFGGYTPLKTHLKLTEEAQNELVAICSLVNSIHDRIDTLTEGIK